MSSLIESTQIQLQQNYLADQRPWVVAFSGGKDSTLVLQLVYELVLRLHQTQQPLKPVYIIASDTRVESPNIAEYLVQTLEHIQMHADAKGLPIQVHLVQPDAANSFWGNLIGKGYPAPTRWFRWCTTKMKIKPTRRVIEKITAQHGSVVLLLGTRFAESHQRRQRMAARETNSRGLNPHSEVPNALVYSPIAEWSTDAVWAYLFHHNPAPWGGGHDFMLELYRQASGGECPVVFDLNTPSCGNSRFGCWTCTVVKHDKSIEGFIQAGETWLQPLNEFRNWLKVIREDPKLRLAKRRDGSEGMGPFSRAARELILTRLLETEQKVGKMLITDAEIAYIQQQWQRDFHSAETALKLAHDYGREVNTMPYTPSPSEEKELISQLVVDFELQEAWIEDLLYLVTKKYTSWDMFGHKEALKRDIKAIIDKSIAQEELADQ